MQQTRRRIMAIKLIGEWDISVKSKEAAFDQRVIIVGTTNGQDGTYHHATFGTKTLQGAFAIQIQYEKDDAWFDSLMCIGTVSRLTTKLNVEIKSDDNVGYGDLDFNDLILEASRTVDDSDWCIWGQVKQYSGCIFNPCLLPRLVVDDWVHVVKRLPQDLVFKLEPILPEVPPLDFPYPPPPPPWDYRAIRVEVPLTLLQESLFTKRPSSRRGAFRTMGFKALSNPGTETYNIAEAVNIRASELVPAFIGKLKTKCRIDPVPGAILRVIDYDPGPGESPGQLFAGTGDKEVLGHVITDDQGYYLYCFSWSYPGVGGLRPDILLQLIQINEEGIPSVKLESRISWNIDNLYRKDFCVPSHLVGKPPPDDVVNPDRIFQYVGNLPVDRITQLGPEKGYATSQSGDLVTVIRAPFGSVLYLKGSFHNYSQVTFYRIEYWTSDNPDGNIGLTTLLTPLTYYDANFDLVTVGPGPVLFPNVPADAYPVMRDNYAYSHPFGRQYKAYINTCALKTGLMKTGFLHIKIQGLDSTGANVSGAMEQFTIRIDNVPPVPEIEPITAGSSAGAGCGFITLQNPSDKFPLTYRVNDSEGHLFKYYFNLWKCHNNLVGDTQYNPVYDDTYPLLWFGTIDDISGVVAAPLTWDGWVTVNMPHTGELFSAQDIANGVTFVAVSIELWAVSRTTDGRHNHLHWPRYVEVIGVKL
jgi:hypothetical protein